ncbi:hypothetical protein MKEN_01131800 [Mycena kentingensis (nom. inval.)]|nr:hypothetical protein MKEN_01131800 [Mycena kentingensis (nom. inval.)]
MSSSSSGKHDQHSTPSPRRRQPLCGPSASTPPPRPLFGGVVHSLQASDSSPRFGNTLRTMTNELQSRSPNKVVSPHSPARKTKPDSPYARVLIGFKLEEDENEKGKVLKNELIEIADLHKQLENLHSEYDGYRVYAQEQYDELRKKIKEKDIELFHRGDRAEEVAEARRKQLDAEDRVGNLAASFHRLRSMLRRAVTRAEGLMSKDEVMELDEERYKYLDEVFPFMPALALFSSFAFKLACVREELNTYRQFAQEELDVLLKKIAQDEELVFHAQESFQELTDLRLKYRNVAQHLGSMHAEQLHAERRAALRKQEELEADLAAANDRINESAPLRAYCNNPENARPVSTRTRSILSSLANGIPTGTRPLRYRNLAIVANTVDIAGDEFFGASWPYQRPLLVIQADTIPCNDERTIFIGHQPLRVYSARDGKFIDNNFLTTAVGEYQVLIAASRVDESARYPLVYAGRYQLTSLAAAIPGGFAIPADVSSRVVHATMFRDIQGFDERVRFADATSTYKAGLPWVEAYALNLV